MSVHNIDCWKYLEENPETTFDHVITDPLYDDDYESILKRLRRVTRGNIILFSPPNKLLVNDYTDLNFWIKTPSTKNTSKRCSNFVEFIQIFEGEYKVFNNDLHWSQYTGVWNDPVEFKGVHPWIKPYSLIERLVRIFTNPGDLVFDPFAGSGQTFRACRRNGRRFEGCEKDEKYIEIANKESLNG